MIAGIHKWTDRGQVMCFRFCLGPQSTERMSSETLTDLAEAHNSGKILRLFSSLVKAEAMRRVGDAVGLSSPPDAAAVRGRDCRWRESFPPQDAGTSGTDIASSHDRSMAVSVSHISLCICSATARRAAPSSRLRRCSAERTSRTRRSIPVTRKVDVDGESRAQMFDHLIAFIGLSFEQKLVDDRGRIGLFAQASGGLLQVLGPVRFLAGGGVQGIGAL